MGISGQLRGALVSFGQLWEALGHGEVWPALGSSEELWAALGSSGEIWGVPAALCRSGQLSGAPGSSGRALGSSLPALAWSWLSLLCFCFALPCYCSLLCAFSSSVSVKKKQMYFPVLVLSRFIGYHLCRRPLKKSAGDGLLEALAQLGCSLQAFCSILTALG